MGEYKSKEVKYLQDKIKDISYNENRFKLMMGSEKFLFGIVIFYPPVKWHIFNFFFFGSRNFDMLQLNYGFSLGIDGGIG